MTVRNLLFLLPFAVLLGGCATTAELQRRSITPDQVVEMSKAGESADAIIQKLKDSQTVYQLSAAGLVKLHEQGVPDAVLDYMQGTYVDAVRQEESRRAYFYQPYPYFYGGRFYSPYYYPWWW